MAADTLRSWARASVLATAASMVFVSASQAAITWDGGGGDSLWFNAPNWSSNGLPPGATAPPTAAPTNPTDTGIYSGVNVLYDPTNDPSFAAASGFQYPTGYGPQTIWRLYISNTTSTANNTLTIASGDLNVRDSTAALGTGSAGTGQVIVGRSYATGSPAVTGSIVQTGGAFRVRDNVLDLGQSQTPTDGTPQAGNGIYDHRGGTLQVGIDGGGSNGVRIGAGAGSTGRFISRNTAATGLIEVQNYISAQANSGGTLATTEFHYGAGGVRTINVRNSLDIRNNGTAISRLSFILDETPEAKGNDGTFFIPEDLGLFNNDSDGDGTFGGANGLATGERFRTLAATLGDLTTENIVDGSTISATFGGFTYNWTIEYDGNIGTGGAITGSGTGNDIVLIGLSSTQPIAAVPEPTTLAALAGVAGVALRRRRR